MQGHIEYYIGLLARDLFRGRLVFSLCPALVVRLRFVCSEGVVAVDSTSDLESETGNVALSLAAFVASVEARRVPKATRRERELGGLIGMYGVDFIEIGAEKVSGTE